MNNKNKKAFYITTTLPYVNSDPHIGHAMEFVRADIIARYKRSLGYDVFFNSGTDEHGSKIHEGAIKENMSTQEYVDKYSKRFKDFLKLANISNDEFVRTTDEKHILAAQEMWKRCHESGDIYKKNYKVKYCAGCELEKTDSELVDSKCADHPNKEIEIREEENYFFRYSKYQQKLLDFYSRSENKFVIPESRQNEVKNFVASGLQDFSISRLKEKMPWGVAVPAGSCDEGDENKHVMYVWFDALTSYISTLGWPEGENKTSPASLSKREEEKSPESNFAKYWTQNQNLKSAESNLNTKREVVQYCGKDNNRQQSAMWQAMLMSAELPNSTNIVIDGFIQSGGVKMSKSIGNVISPFEIIDEYKRTPLRSSFAGQETENKLESEIKKEYLGTEYSEEVLRFVLCHEVSSFEDRDITHESIRTAYTAYLQNGIGNQVNRILKLSSTHLTLEDIKIILEKAEQGKLDVNYTKYLDEYKICEATHVVTDKIKKLDEYIQSSEPFKLIKSDGGGDNVKAEQDKQRAVEIIKESVLSLCEIGHHFYFFMPRVSIDIYNHIKENKMPSAPLFGRVENVI